MNCVFCNCRKEEIIHIIPRYKGDVEKPKGGIRNFKVALVEY